MSGIVLNNNNLTFLLNYFVEIDGRRSAYSFLFIHISYIK